MKKTLFAATVLAASLMAASTVQAAPQEVTMWHYRMIFTSMQHSYPEQS